MQSTMKNNGRTSSLSGSVSSVIYHNEENGYSVLEISTEDDSYTAVGICPSICSGETVTLFGEWVHHSDYGRQFKFENYEKHLPQTENAILRYLSSGAVKGIGPITAARIVDAFGTDTFEVIEHRWRWLCQIQGISEAKAKRINEEFCAVSGIRTTMMFFRDFVSSAVAIRIFNTLGAGAVDKVKKNPYILCETVDGVGFEVADNIANSIGYEKESEERIGAGLKYILSASAAQNGHTVLPYRYLCTQAAELLCITEKQADAILEKEIAKETIASYTSDDGGRMTGLWRYFRAERYIQRKLDDLDIYARGHSMSDCERLIEMTELEEGIKYEGLQRRAIYEALMSGVFILAGGPGTGKTTVIRALIGIFESMGMRIGLCAPTGRAAKRMSEATGRDAMTVHRMLEMEAHTGREPRFLKNEENLLECDVIILDEASMLDVLLAEALLRAIKNGARLILIGDPSQLPSVGAGNVLADIISSQAFRSVILKKIFRQAESSLIVTNAHAINEGRYPCITRTDSDFFFLPRKSEAEISRTVCSLVSERLVRAYGEMAKSGLQVITPSRRGGSGTQSLNALLQSALNPKKSDSRELCAGGVIFREGDRVMQTKNNYEIIWEKDGYEGSGIFNGDIGKIISIEHSRQYLLIDFDSKEVKYDFTLLDELEHAYAITVHKSQGSEYPIVVIPIYDCPTPLRSRNLLYTALTRAKNIAVLVGKEEILCEMVDSFHETVRYTSLLYHINHSKTART